MLLFVLFTTQNFQQQSKIHTAQITELKKNREGLFQSVKSSDDKVKVSYH